MGEDTFNRIRFIIAADLDAPSKVMLPTSFIDDLHADSHAMIELIMAWFRRGRFGLHGYRCRAETAIASVNVVEKVRHSEAVI